MQILSDSTLTIIIIIVAALFGALFMQLYLQRRMTALRQQNTELATTLELERRNTEDKIASVNQARQQLSDAFAALSSQALKHNSEEFLKLAQENLKAFHTQAQGELTQKEKAIEHLIKPIKEALQKTEQQIQGMEKERKQAYGALHQHLENMAQAQASLQDETSKLVTALRRPEVRGQWGELTLKRLAELSGMRMIMSGR